ncbi:MAG: hypothetical protein PHC52_13420 [Syntrophales bacterium]|nr:hypothetical protein [Syntrophales bacterium]
MPAKGLVIKQFKVYVGGYDLSANHQRARVSITRKEVQAPSSGLLAMPRHAGFLDLSLDHSGWWEAGTGKPDTVLAGILGSADQNLTLALKTGAVGEPVYFTRTTALRYELGGRIGEMVGFSGGAFAQGDAIVRGYILKTGAITQDGNGTAYQLGAVAAGKYLYGAAHCFATTGSGDRALTLKIQSCAAENFSAGVSDRITFPDFTTSVGAQWATPVTGPITDTWWRANWTSVGLVENFTALVVMGIR